MNKGYRSVQVYKCTRGLLYIYEMDIVIIYI